MNCKNPYMAGNIAYGCGQCLPCRINRRRQWMWRQYLESLNHVHSSFVTLTYDDEHLPSGASLVPADMSNFLKRLRKALSPTRIRFYGVGEYGHAGTRDFNPHYHLSLFGLSGFTDYSSPSLVTHYGSSKLIWDCWDKGRTECVPFSEQTAHYVAGYITKKLTAPDEPFLGGRHPEFARMSNRPGLAHAAALQIARQLSSMHLNWETGDVPKHILYQGKKIPLGRYLLRICREALGFTPQYIAELKQQVATETSIELLALYEATKTGAPDDLTTPKSVHLDRTRQRIVQIENRANLYADRKKL